MIAESKLVVRGVVILVLVHSSDIVDLATQGCQVLFHSASLFHLSCASVTILVQHAC